jgi:signal transduction histidine kinase/CheY-like chemotaxis protein
MAGASRFLLDTDTMSQWRYGKEMSTTQRYAIALLIAVAAGALHWLLWPAVGALRPFVFYLPAAGVAAAALGPGPGVLLLLVGAIGTGWPLHEFSAWASPSSTDPMRLALYLMLGTLLIALGASLRNSRARAAAAEDRLSMAIEGTGIGVFDIDLVGHTVRASPVLARLAGAPVTDEAVPLSTWTAHIPAQLLAESREQIAHRLKQGATYYERELSVPSTDDTHPQPRQLLLRVHVIWRSQRAVRLRGACVDVTERKQIDAQLEATRGQLSQQVDDLNHLHELSTHLLETPQLVRQLSMILGAVAHFHGARRGMVSLCEPGTGGLRIEASLGFDAAALAMAESLGTGPCAEACRQHARVVVEDTRTSETFQACRDFFETQAIRAVHSTPLINSHGQVLGAITVYLDEPREPTERERRLADICARKAAVFAERASTRDELLVTQGRFEAVLAASGAPFVILRPVRQAHRIVDFEWVYLNRAAAEALGCGADAVVGQRVLRNPVCRWMGHPAFSYCVTAVESASTCEFDAVDHEGEQQRWLHCIASPIPDGLGVWFTDISERMRNEQLLRESGRRKDEFLATLAHELRNPLAPIRQATLLAMSPHTSDEQKRWSCEVIDRQVSHMALLLDDLLDISRITRGALALRRSPTDLASVLTSALETAHPLIDAKGHQLLTAIDDEPIVFDADPLRLAQVVGNLLTNAAKYTDPGGTIELRAGRRGDAIVIEVQDNGIGIPPESMPEAFRMFAQLRPTSERNGGGLGIGLALSKGLVELHGGTLTGSSEGVGRGSVFTIRLPAAQASLPAPADGQEPAVRERRRLRVLIADDNRDASDTLAALLEADGHELRMAYDGNEALRLWRQERPDVCLLDIGMPGRTGYQVAREIRRTPGGEATLLVAVTGWSQLHDRELALEAGFDLHLTKPVSPLQLSHLLDHQVKAPAPASTAAP